MPYVIDGANSKQLYGTGERHWDRVKECLDTHHPDKPATCDEIFEPALVLELGSF